MYTFPLSFTPLPSQSSLALTLLAGRQEGHPACKNTIPAFSKVFSEFWISLANPGEPGKWM